MPIFHEQVEESASPSAERHEQDVADNEWTGHFYPFENAREKTPASSLPYENMPLSRGELIERLKRGESPSWTIRHGFGRKSPDQTGSQKHSPQQSPSTSLLPAAELEGSPIQNLEQELDHHKAGLEIERPRSALHSGDFREEKDDSTDQDSLTPSLAISPVAPWHSDFPPFMGARSFNNRPPSRSRTVSRSPFSTFTLLPPTSPLVQVEASYNSDLELSPTAVPRRSGSPQRENRRHTFSPHSFQTFGNSAFNGLSTTSPRPQVSLRREGTYPYQAHQPRRSVTQTNHLNSFTTPQTPLCRPRRTSNASELSPLHHAPMVGSYEESILRGRMSTTPSRPLNFVAQIGVLGKGKCKASLKCPPHVIVPFPAVFYSYGNASGRMMDNQPSPYVGLIDLENSLPPQQDNEDEGRRRRRYASPMKKLDELAGTYRTSSPSGSVTHTEALRRKKERLKRRSESPKAPHGGSYRIPQQGQLQIILKNPNKTAVKLFLVPYDLSDMEPGQKTFIRQRSYSAGAIIDMPISARTNLGTDRPEASLSHSEDPRDRPVLRYLVHLNICCPSKGRYYLHNAIRVVFANRVPDGKEKLRNEVQLPDPRYSAYKPQRDAPATTTVSAAEKAARRRSTPLACIQNNFESANALSWTARSFNETPVTSPIRSFADTSIVSTIRPIPFTLNRLETVESRPVSREHMDLDSPFKSKTNSENVPIGQLPDSWLEKRTSPLSSAGSSVASGISASLLARQLRGVSLELDDE
ncbi:hypothetical protein BLS_001058 [Venturia inaequalis]|uniref:Atos-like conserved domain-containing protein n=1 Tax=Venturia inaequalis TaxID=5025 RepID=A0A8H3UDT9_VENIN|nr:hypothetical protein EG328_007309 [Venturia inaequalis]KAE9977872.1 hypothetical protein BLS_001058 [Venturia inaequalis]RDI82731.1 hypothetical protein Vi05172_g7285 [Venturia inaequalis]